MRHLLALRTALAIAAVSLLTCHTALAAGTDEPNDEGPNTNLSSTEPGESPHHSLKGILTDVKDYYTSPLRWDGTDWALFGGSLGAIALAHHYDSQVRAHFVQGSGASSANSDLEDALPGAALLFGTYVYSTQWHDKSGFTVTWAMAEAAGLGTVTSYALKFAAGRERPNETSDPNQWHPGSSGSSFPSLHVVAAFAIGTTFAESGITW